ncbi:hypothetical protein KX729_09335 [Rhizobium sp. XQZ8]|uniref:hypothetical protein n=1 Tax=Rhizobium populisoli TaxID=2859785 RepID=UPI001CA4DA40|nr:hypothetical protein [Rhizobium populisoli]MBW6421642.1 hypothetical protein [Rhizobium populisoli]
MSGKLTAANILAQIKRNTLEKAKTHANEINPVILDWAMTERASIKSERGNDFFSGQGAHSLSIRSREKLLNRCAPDGADNASSEVVSSDLQSGEKARADARSHPTTASEARVNSLCSSTRQDEVTNGCAEMDPQDDPAGQHVDFYEIKTDLFDNTGRGKKSTVHRAKLMIRAEPTTSAKEADVFMLDFYNRSRDINKRLKEMEVENHAWYLGFKAEFNRYSEMLVAWEIPPKLAVLKELIMDDGSSEIVGYGAGIMFQVKNQAPTVIFFYGASRFELVLDLEFNRTPGSPIFKKGIYRDPARQHLDVDLTATKKKFKIKTMKDFN